MKKVVKNQEKSKRFMKLIDLNSDEQRLSFGLQMTEFINNLHKQGLHQDLNIKLFYDPQDNFELTIK